MTLHEEQKKQMAIFLNRKTMIHSMLLGLVFALTAGYSAAQQGTSAGPPVRAPESHIATPAIEKISPGIFRIGEIQIHKKAGSITFPAQVNMDKGLLEYLLVQSQGKTHESLLRTDVEPYYLNIAFLLLGFEGTDQPLTEQGSEQIPGGEPVEISVIFHDGSKNQTVPAESWLETRTDKTVLPVSLTWKYTGSQIMSGAFQAQAQGSIAAIFHDPVALIDHDGEGGVNDEIWFVNEEATPPAGTPVTVTITAKK